MYLGNKVQGAILGVAITDAHPSNRDVLDGVIILRSRQTNSIRDSRTAADLHRRTT